MGGAMRTFPDPRPGIPRTDTPTAYLWWLVARYRASILLGMGYGVVCMLAQALMPAAIGKAIDAGLTARDRTALVLWGGLVLGLAVVQGVTGILQDRCAVTSRLGATYQTMQLVTRQVSRLGASLPGRVSTGEVVSVGVADITRIGAALAVTARGAGAVVTVVTVAVIMLSTSWQLGLVVLVGVPLMAGALAGLIRPLHARQQRLRDQQGEVTTLAVDIVGGLRVLRGVGGEAVFLDRYAAGSQRARRAGVLLARIESVLDGAKVLLPGVLVVVVVWVGAGAVLDHRLSPGQLVAFYAWAAFLAVPLSRLTQTADALTRGYVAARRIIQLLALEPTPRSSESVPGGLNGSATLADPDSGLTVRPGRITAVVCADPADATALADRLGRYADSAVTYGGVALDEIPVGELRRRILVAGNDAMLFSGPLRAELDPADRHDEALLRKRIEAASALDVIDAGPDGLDGQVIRAGLELSGGQRQRLRLVRALMAEPEVLLLVEPTNAVDAHTEARMAGGLRAARANATTVVFSTSPIVLDRADHVVFLAGDRVLAEGTHAELLADARYRGVVSREEAS
jgi:ABC-type multidrug transport system fused ATPase/permease subunit